MTFSIGPILTYYIIISNEDLFQDSLVILRTSEFLGNLDEMFLQYHVYDDVFTEFRSSITQ